MYKIKPMESSNGEQYFNLTKLPKERLNTKFTIHEKNTGIYYATSATGNSELISFLDRLSYLQPKVEKSDGYYWWKVDPKKIITLMNAVIREFEEKI